MQATNIKRTLHKPDGGIVTEHGDINRESRILRWRKHFCYVSHGGLAMVCARFGSFAANTIESDEIVNDFPAMWS
jgi:hypothetical protein